ncbi:hypothetical protein [Pseudomonas viridiflava]|uniref:AbiU2 domain-containing protein n=1 Tax=Pseudomonas viridiflava TaxID=33069 RepID=UPI002EAF4778|nr:hypothetical protein [Pseudomonas viridiflava]
MFDIRNAATDIAMFLSFATDIRREAVLYEQMFCDENSVAIANDTFPDTLSVVRRCVFVSVITRLCAMFDPPESMNRENFSFAHLKAKYSDHFSDELLQDCFDIEDRIRDLGIKGFRNKLIAHHDKLAVFGNENYVHNIEPNDLPELLDSIIDLFCSLIDAMPGRGEITMTGKGAGDFSDSDNGTALLLALDAGAKK